MKTIKSEMVSFPFVIEPTMTIAEAKTFMAQQNLRHLPVVDSGNKLMGVVSERDVLSSKKPNIPITNIMVAQVFVVQENESIHTVIETMANEKYGSVLIVNAANELTGIFTTIDALNLLGKLLKSDSSAKKPLILSLLDLTRA
jgi:IMP dehydrogenase